MEDRKKTEKYKIYIKEYNRKWYLRNKEKRIAQNKMWRKNNPEKVKAFPHKRPEYAKNYQLKARHGITLEQFNQMFTTQNGCCAICGRNFKNNKDTCVDHDHNTGKIRQLLCFNCNIGIGKFGDSINLVELALNYLKKWS